MLRRRRRYGARIRPRGMEYILANRTPEVILTAGDCFHGMGFSKGAAIFALVGMLSGAVRRKISSNNRVGSIMNVGAAYAIYAVNRCGYRRVK